jgi:GT2 family glycosyltransferase
MISILIVTYGDRFNYLKQVLDACVLEYKNNRDKLLEIIIIDNASSSSEKIKEFIQSNLEVKIKHIQLGTNTGSAGGYGIGLKYFLNTGSEYVLLLDDDNVPEINFLKLYISALNIFPKDYRNKVALSGRRLFHDKESFYGRKIPYSPKFLFGYNIFNPKTVLSLIKKHLFNNKKYLLSNKFTPMYKNHSLVYGGVFLSKDIVKKVGFPLDYLFTYGDDTEYGSRIIKNGFAIYQLFIPYISDVDISNRSDSYLSVFSETTKPFRVFYSFRNNTYLSRYVYNSNLFCLVVNLVAILFIYNVRYILKYGFKKILLSRNKLIIIATYKGLKSDFSKFNF